MLEVDMIAESSGKFQEILSYIKTDAQNKQLYEVEKDIYKKLLELGKIFLIEFLKVKGNGDQGEKHVDVHGITREKKSSKREKTYYSLFGKVSLNRAYYYKEGEGGICPLDAELNIPEKSYSYLLSALAARLGAEASYKKTTEIIDDILGVKLCNEVVKTMMKDASVNAKEYYEKIPAPKKEEEGSILVLTADCKGVPIIKEQGEPKKRKLKKGEKPGKKKMSTVTAIYTIDPNIRTANDLVKEFSATPKEPPTPCNLKANKKNSRPKPKNKIVRATMNGKEAAFDELAQFAQKREPQSFTDKVVLVDGERSLRKLTHSKLKNFTVIMDIYHVIEYLWLAAYVFCQEGSQEASNWVSARLHLLLSGKVSCFITSLEYELQNSKLSASNTAVLNKVLTYFTNGKKYMSYDLYLKKGYPIGSGIVEGACRNLVKDRLELTGMRWHPDGAEAVLQMRSIDINQHSDSFWIFHTRMEYQRLYSHYLIPCPSLNLVA